MKRKIRRYIKEYEKKKADKAATPAPKEKKQKKVVADSPSREAINIAYQAYEIFLAAVAKALVYFGMTPEAAASNTEEMRTGKLGENWLGLCSQYLNNKTRPVAECRNDYLLLSERPMATIAYNQNKKHLRTVEWSAWLEKLQKALQEALSDAVPCVVTKITVVHHPKAKGYIAVDVRDKIAKQAYGGRASSVQKTNHAKLPRDDYLTQHSYANRAWDLFVSPEVRPNERYDMCERVMTRSRSVQR